MLTAAQVQVGAIQLHNEPVPPDPGVALALRPEGARVRIGPQTSALAALLTCGHYLPVGRTASVLDALAGIRVSTGFMAGGRGRAATLLEGEFLPHLQAPLRTAGWCSGARR